MKKGIGLAALLMVLLLYGCTAQADTELELERDRLQTSLDQMVDEYDALRAQYDAVETELQSAQEALKDAQREGAQAEGLPLFIETSLAGRLEPESAVYVSRGGRKYHVENCLYVGDGYTKMQLQEAQEQGFTPCSKCVGEVVE